jgi:hypothetical protein
MANTLPALVRSGELLPAFFRVWKEYNPVHEILNPYLSGGKTPMSQKTFSLVATVVFLVVGLMHALRLFFGWHVELNGWIVPLWVSWVGLVIGLYLASEGIGLVRKG